MDITYDPVKNQRNIDQRGLSFERVRDLDFTKLKAKIDTRRDYGETRYRVFAPLDGRLHALVFTETETGIRVISFRKAHWKEVRAYNAEA